MGKITLYPRLAPDHFPDLPVIDGVRFATIAAGVRYQGRTDVMLAELTPGSTVAGAFTRSATRAAPVLTVRPNRAPTSDTGAAIWSIRGNANAFTGKGGVIAVEAITAAVADVVQHPPVAGSHLVDRRDWRTIAPRPDHGCFR